MSTHPFKSLSRIAIIHLVHFVTMGLNAWSIKTGISSTVSPRELTIDTELSVKHMQEYLWGLLQDSQNPTHQIQWFYEQNQSFPYEHVGTSRNLFDFCASIPKML